MTKCPYCGYFANQHEELIDEGKSPKLEDVSFCIKCGEISKFTKKGLVKQNINELDEKTLEIVLDIRERWCGLTGNVQSENINNASLGGDNDLQ